VEDIYKSKAPPAFLSSGKNFVDTGKSRLNRIIHSYHTGEERDMKGKGLIESSVILWQALLIQNATLAGNVHGDWHHGGG